MKYTRLKLERVYDTSLPVRGAWVEILINIIQCITSVSLPVRGAWVEIRICQKSRRDMCVAPRAGSVG